MKKISEMKSGMKKQILGGMVYMALAVTVVAVTVGSVVSYFGESSKEITEVKHGGDTIYNGNYKVELPENNMDIGGFTLDTPVSESPSGVDAQVIIPEAVTEDILVVPSETIVSDIALTENEEAPVYSDKSKPIPEEPEEAVFEYGFDGFIKPCSGYISKEFSGDLPVYSVSMYDYRAHNGVDIVGEIGTPVKATSNGVISDVYDDYLYGTTVVIEHSDGIKSVYSNLSPDLPVETTVGRAVMTGEIIAGIGDSAECEAAEVSHVHFEIIKDGKHVDPKEYFANS